jgi:hypothetical protein
MSDTIGSLVDKLITADLKMWNNQEIYYEIRHMDFAEFKQRYLSEEKDQEDIFNCFKKVADLNVQRNNIIDEIDEKIVEIIKDGVSGKDIDLEGYIQKKHKSY